MVRMKAPVGHTGVSFGGEQFAVDEAGIVEVPGEAVGALRGFGFVNAPAAEKGDPGEKQLSQVLEQARAAVNATVVETVAEVAAPAPAPAPAKTKKAAK